jgi:triacylglycerol esterase/lipase EstA (alpha/beta hydrolase family)
MNLKPTSKIQGINFFDTPDSCISHFKATPWTNKAISFLISFGTLLAYTLYRIGLIWNRVDAQMDPLTKTTDRILSKKRLVVCLHGVNNNPSQFKKIVDELQKRDISETDIFIPRILKKGNDKLDKMVQPILKTITEWAKTSDEKELVLVGISNGGRIARAVKAEIAKSNSTNIKKLHFVSIVGACKGSSLANWANKLPFISRFVSKNILEEMPINSKRNQQLDLDWNNELSSGPSCQYTFFASPHDWMVPDFDSTLMKTVETGAQYAIVPRHGHNSIVNAIAEPVAKIVLGL